MTRPLHPPRVFVVVNAVSPGYVYEWAHQLTDAGVDGLFLINHDVNAEEMIDAATCLRDIPFVGINPLGVLSDKAAVMAHKAGLDGLWVDNVGTVDQCERAWEICRLGNVEFFGGVEFKYQARRRIARPRTVNDYRHSANVASRMMDVVTTSGDATGEPPEFSKVDAMRYDHGKRLAIASGIDKINIRPMYLHGATDFLVRTSLLRSGSNRYDLREVRALVRAVSEFKQPSPVMAASTQGETQ